VAEKSGVGQPGVALAALVATGDGVIRRFHRRRWRRPGYRLVHVQPDGARQVVGAPIGAWPDALARAERLALTLRMEVERGNLDAGGAVWVIDTENGTIVQSLPVSAGP
jgi:hypothetical protein